ncbi:hypothetical protein ACHAWF_006865 [Thalassiosira exigua]
MSNSRRWLLSSHGVVVPSNFLMRRAATTYARALLLRRRDIVVSRPRGTDVSRSRSTSSNATVDRAWPDGGGTNRIPKGIIAPKGRAGLLNSPRILGWDEDEARNETEDPTPRGRGPPAERSSHVGDGPERRRAREHRGSAGAPEGNC